MTKKRKATAAANNENVLSFDKIRYRSTMTMKPVRGKKVKTSQHLTQLNLL